MVSGPGSALPAPPKSLRVHIPDPGGSPSENLLSPQRLSDPTVTSSDAMRTSTAPVSENNQDASLSLSALQQADEKRRKSGGTPSKPRDADSLKRAEDASAMSNTSNVEDGALQFIHDRSVNSRSMYNISVGSLGGPPTTSGSITPASSSLPKDNGGARFASMWDPDEDEFDRWPGQETLNRIAANMSTKHGTFAGSQQPMSKESTLKASAQDTSTFEAGGEYSDATSMLSDETKAFIRELQTMNEGKPRGRDKHDEVMQQFYSDICRALPSAQPARCMHLVDVDAFMNSRDPVVEHASPRLCDAVATVLFKTNPKCLEDFLNPEVRVFEWRRSPCCVMIHRDGPNVIVGTYHNFGTLYVWSYFVRSVISDDGTWTELYAALTPGKTPVTKQGVLFDKFEAGSADPEISPENEELALYVGRQLACFLLKQQVWDYRRWMKFMVNWEADGVTTSANEIDPNQVGDGEDG